MARLRLQEKPKRPTKGIQSGESKADRGRIYKFFFEIDWPRTVFKLCRVNFAKARTSGRLDKDGETSANLLREAKVAVRSHKPGCHEFDSHSRIQFGW